MTLAARSGRIRVLIVNCFSDRERGARGNPRFVPQALTPYALAGVLDAEQCEIRVACEFANGPLEDLRLLAWPQVLVLTGLNPALDRMKQLCAYARLLAPGVRVIVGGPLARVLPRHCARFFDLVLGGDVEQLAEALGALHGRSLMSAEPLPRFDLVPRRQWTAHAESGRNCNFRCNFCAMTAEGRAHAPRPVAELRRTLELLGPQRCVMFLDQNFYAGARADFDAKLDLLAEFHARGSLRGWAALVTAEFFARPELLARAQASGCIGFFSGVESLDAIQLARMHKKQNLVLPQFERITRCLDAGLSFHYGLIHDPLACSGQALLDELRELLARPVTLPSFVSLAIPLIGTPLFDERLQAKALLPGIRLRDMDGRSLLTQSLDGERASRDLIARMETGGLAPRAAVLAHGLRLAARYAGRMRPLSFISALSPNAALLLPGLGTARRERLARSHDARTEPLGSLYRPLLPMPERLRAHFEPTQVTDAEGALHEDVRADLEPRKPRRSVVPLVEEAA